MAGGERLNIFVIIYLCIVVSTFLLTIKDFDCFACTPKEIYECNNINMFGAVLIFVVAFLLNPILFILKFLWWIFHVGRDGG